MTRERKEIRKQMDALYIEERIEYEFSCGFGDKEIAAAYAPRWDELNEKLAASYGKTVAEYEEMVYKHREKLFDTDDMPFI